MSGFWQKGPWNAKVTSWGNTSPPKRNTRKNPPSPARYKAPVPQVRPSRPKRGDVFETKIFDGYDWVTAIDADGEYGGPYWDMCDLFKNSKYRSDMLDIYGVPFQPSLAEKCRDRTHLRILRQICDNDRSRSRSRGRSRSRNSRRR